MNKNKILSLALMGVALSTQLGGINAEARGSRWVKCQMTKKQLKARKKSKRAKKARRNNL